MASPTPSLCDTATTNSNYSDSDMESGGPNTMCSICNDIFSMPKVLCCFHTYCQPCLEKIQETDKVTCPECHFQTFLGPDGLSGLKLDYAVSNILETTVPDVSILHCTGCKSKETSAVARCFDCANFLCENCVMAHQFMHCFEGHHVVSLGELYMNKDDNARVNKLVNCPKHKTDVLKFYCKTCSQPICKECTVLDHARGHECKFLMDVSDKEIESMRHLETTARAKVGQLQSNAKKIGVICTSLQTQYNKAQTDIGETYGFYQSMLDERKTEVLKELDQAYNMKQVAVRTLAQSIQDGVEKLGQGMEFMEKVLKHASTTEILLLQNFIEQRFQNMFNFLPENSEDGNFDLEFMSNFQAIQAGVHNTFGYVRHESDDAPTKKPNPIARPKSTTVFPQITSFKKESLDLSEPLRFPSPTTSDFAIHTPDSSQYEQWSSGLDILCSGVDLFSPAASTASDLTSQLLSPNIYSQKSPIRRQKMIYHCRFGEFGVLEGQFTEPSGVAVTGQNNIIVADTNNHRIQTFDQEGRFKFQFGQCGKHDGQLLYPNRVSVMLSTGDLVVTERSPTHQVQIYTQYGHFVRKFGANILQHPRGVTVDNQDRIIIVECKVMRVIVFDQFGNILSMFGCSKHVQFPNSVVVNDKEEIFISDNRAHCVKVFSYQGAFLRQIGGEGITNYPIGVRLSAAGEVIVADNHNNFNLTVFTQKGQLINAFESKVKHAQCFDVALMEDSVVLASKDYKLYIYKYI